MDDTSRIKEYIQDDVISHLERLMNGDSGYLYHEWYGTGQIISQWNHSPYIQPIRIQAEPCASVPEPTFRLQARRFSLESMISGETIRNSNLAETRASLIAAQNYVVLGTWQGLLR